MQKEIGRKIDVSEIIAQFEAKEGDVEHIIGKTGSGKTYEATRRALEYLRRGNVVYTTWRLNLPDVFDERESLPHLWARLFFFKKRFYRYRYKDNWKFVNLDDYLDEDGVFDTKKFAKFLASRTDCIFMLDEGQDTFDSHDRASKIARQSITRTRHMHKKLIIISQRAQAVDVNARGNVTYFYKCEARYFWFMRPYFKVYISDEIDNANSYPVWERMNSVGDIIWKAPLYHSGFAKKEVFDAYDSWYMRKGMQKSQDVHIDGFDLSTFDKIRLIFRRLRAKPPVKDIPKLSPSYPQPVKIGVDTQSTENMVKLNRVSRESA